MVSLLVGKIIDENNRVLIQILADELNPLRDADFIRLLARRMTTELDSTIAATILPAGVLPDDITSTEEFDTLVNSMRNVLEHLKYFYEMVSQRSIYELKNVVGEKLLQFLKDTEVLLSMNEVRVGDEVFITISNKTGEGDVPRSLNIRLVVQEFGLIRRVSDSFLFLQRRGVKEKKLTPAEVMAGNTEQPLEVNLEPAAGATLSWTYRPRKDKPFLRWLEPGFGINVSFPRFGSEIASFENNSSDPSGTAVPTLNVTESSNPIDVAVGPVLTFFNNAVTLTYGWNLTVDDKRSYWGIGFSFVNLVRKIGGDE